VSGLSPEGLLPCGYGSRSGHLCSAEAVTPPPTPREGRRAAGCSRYSVRFYVGAAAYTFIVVALFAVPHPGWVSFAAELVTLPAGLILFCGGTSIAAAMGISIGRFGALLYYGLFAIVAIANAIIWYELAQFIRQARRNRGPR
jgi:hypothetical protein